MATVCVKILKHHLKNDGTFNVKIRITHKKEKRYIDTDHLVTEKQLSKNMAIKGKGEINLTFMRLIELSKGLEITLKELVDF